MNVQPLTWYPGTVLPYASLWHTLARATWLNDLRPGDILSRVEGKRPEDGEQPWRDEGIRGTQPLRSNRWCLAVVDLDAARAWDRGPGHHG